MNEINCPSVTIEEITMNHGESIKLEKDDIVILVGGNNVGKSRSLKDIRADIIDMHDKKIIINNIKYKIDNFDGSKMEQYFNEYFEKDNNGYYQIQVKKDATQGYDENIIKNANENSRSLYKLFYSYLGTEDRLSMTNGIPLSYSVNQKNLQIMKCFRRSSSDLNKLNDYLSDAFNNKVCIDIETGSMIYKVGNNAEVKDVLDSNFFDAINKIKPLAELSEQGDGIRSAVAILSSLIAGKHKLFLIDEPETFLHPPQARLMGRYVVDLSAGKQCIIATHSIDFLKGVLERKSSRVKVIKIDREGNNNIFNEVTKDDLKKISNNKSLKYTNMLNGLFYDRVVLCENESDCKFYSSILESVNEDIYLNTLFCGVGGKDSFKNIIPMLKKINIKYFVIADIDLINSQKAIRNLLNSTGADNYSSISEAHNKFLTLFQNEHFELVERQSVIKEKVLALFNDEEYMSTENADKVKKLVSTPNNFKLLKKKGISCISNIECIESFNLIRQHLKDNNIFILDTGELESYCPAGDAHGEMWVNKIFEEHPNIKEDEIYNKAKEFIKEVFQIQNED